MEAINKWTASTTLPLPKLVEQNVLAWALSKFSQIHSINQTRTLTSLVTFIAAAPLFLLSLGTYLKGAAHLKDVSWEKEKFEKLSHAMFISVRVVALAILGAIPFSLYFSLKSGMQTIRARKMQETLQTISQLTGALGFLPPLSKFLWEMSPTDILLSFHTLFHLRFPAPEPTPDLDYKILEEIFENEKYGLQSAHDLPLIVKAVGLPATCTNYGLIGKELTLRGISTLEDLKKHRIEIEPTEKDPTPNWRDKLCPRLCSYLETHSIHTDAYFLAYQLIPLIRHCIELYLFPKLFKTTAFLTLFFLLINKPLIMRTTLSHEPMATLIFIIAVRIFANFLGGKIKPADRLIYSCLCIQFSYVFLQVDFVFFSKIKNKIQNESLLQHMCTHFSELALIPWMTELHLFNGITIANNLAFWVQQILHKIRRSQMRL